MVTMGWIIEENKFDSNNIVSNGNKFMTGNGYMGYRGTLEEYTKKELAACNLAGLYDRHGDSWREPINAPNALFSALSVEGIELGVINMAPIEHIQSLDINNGIHKRCTVWDTEYGKIKIHQNAL
jgi:trehalose/maltose hydrolase-like predicted phosphorylase